MIVGDSVYWNGNCGIITQIGNPHGNRQVKVEWNGEAGGGQTFSWEYVEDTRRMHQLFLDTLKK